MAIRIKNDPAADGTMRSFRKIGYLFKSAVADVLDNSISAKCKNIWIDFPSYDNEDLYITILDDGFGMSNAELFNAMKYGCSRDDYGEEDLGRFGMGLKSASLSQCKVLTVISKQKNEVNAYRWDLDEVLRTKEWYCFRLEKHEIDECPNIEKLLELESGTLVTWQNFDVAYKKSSGHTYEYITKQIDECDSHLRLIFHRFMNGRKAINFYINGYKLKGYDPFLENHIKTDAGKEKEIGVTFKTEDGEGKDYIKVQSFILPHQNDLSNQDIETVGGIESLKDNQGFFIYRNNRLIIYGTWFRLSSRQVNAELYKYGRIRVDIPNTLDDTWDIDVKKQTAVIPQNIINLLRKEVMNVCTGSKEKTGKRARLPEAKGSEKIWAKKSTRQGKDYFHINCESPFIKQYLDSLDDKERVRALRLFDVISANVPFDDIYVSVCNKNNETEAEEEVVDSLILLGIEQFNQIKKFRQCSNEVALEYLCAYPPFNDEKILQEIKRRVCYGN